MTRKLSAPVQVPFLTLDQLPLFADDRDVARAVVGPDLERVRHWLASLPSLEMCGLPKRHTVYSRYVLAVRQFYERQYGIAPAVIRAERPWPTRGGGHSKSADVEKTNEEILARLDKRPSSKRKGRLVN